MKIRRFGSMESWRNVRKEKLKISEFDVRHIMGVYKSRKFYRSGENLDVLSCALRRTLLATDIKTTSMSIVGRVFCEFSRRRVLVVRPRDWYGGKWVSSLWPILSRSSRGTPCFVSTLKYESPGVPSCMGETGIRERDTAQSILSVLRLSLMCASLCQLLSFWARLLNPICASSWFVGLFLTVSAEDLFDC